MKKLLYLLMALPLLMVSCDDDDDGFPAVRMAVETSGCKIVNGVMYVVQGDTLGIDSLTVAAVHQDAGVALVAANYYWDRLFVEATNIPPFAFAIDTKGMMPGKHMLQMRASLISVNYAPVVAIVNYPVRVVLNEEDIPDGTVESKMLVVPEIDD